MGVQNALPPDKLVDLLKAIDDNELNEGVVRSHIKNAMDLRPVLGYAVSTGRIAAVMTMAHQCGARLDSDGEGARMPLASELHAMASEGAWGTVAYFIAVNVDELPVLLRAKDESVRKRLRRAAGFAHVHVPKDVRNVYSKTGSIRCDLHVEQPRWLLPRPRPDQMYLTTQGAKLVEGSYCVVQYPLSDDLKEAVLRPYDFGDENLQQIADILNNSGETLLCKAAKASQWDFLEWIMKNADVAALVRQLEDEFSSIVRGFKCTAFIQKGKELECLRKSINRKGIMKQSWRRGHLVVPAGAKLIWPHLETLLNMRWAATSSWRRLVTKLRPKLEQIDADIVVFVVFELPALEQSRVRWLADLSAVDSRNFRIPLLHRAVNAGQLELLRLLLDNGVCVNSCDARGLSPLAVAVAAEQDEAVELLLEKKYACRVDGCSGALAMASARRSGNMELLEKLRKRQQRSPAMTLEDYFSRQVRGELMNGLEPQGFSAKDDALQKNDVRVWAKAVVVGPEAKNHKVMFANLTPEQYATAEAAESLELSSLLLVPEQQLSKDAVAVAVAPERVMTGPDGAKVRATCGVTGRKGGYGLLTTVPIVARAPAQATVLVKCVTACCGEALSGVEVNVDGKLVGETDDGELKLSVPMRKMQVSAQLDGVQLGQKSVDASKEEEEPEDHVVSIKVPIQCFVYGVESVGVFVCGRPPHNYADEPFVPEGTAKWKGGSTQMTASKPISLGSGACLATLESLSLSLKLPPGQEWRPIAWDDTDQCEFSRIVRNPVKIGTITKEGGESASSYSHSSSRSQSSYSSDDRDEAPEAKKSGDDKSKSGSYSDEDFQSDHSDESK